MFKGNKKNIKLHTELMGIRHEYMAHAGKSVYEYSKMILTLPPFNKFIRNKEVHPGLFNNLYNTIDPDILYYKDIIEELYSFVEVKISELNTRLDPVIKNINADKLYKISKKRKILKNNDFK